MKKLILLFCIISWSYNTNAQCDSTLPVTEDFSDKTAVEYCWDFIDADGDGRNWNVVDLGGGNNAIRSASHIDGVWPFTPDNWIISEGINLTAVGSATLSWKVKARDWNADNENYTVYVSTGNQISNFLSSSVSYSEDLNGTEARWQSRSLDATALEGQIIYVAVRHHNTYDQSAIDFDDLSMTSTGGSGCITDSDNDGVCDSVDQCPGFDDRIDTNDNGIPDGCENATCNEKTANFAINPLTHSGTGSQTTTLTLPSGSQNISFMISGIDEKTKGKENDKYIERVKVTYINGSGITKTNGTYRGDQVSSATINIPGEVESLTVILDDAYDGNPSRTLSVNLNTVTYCASTTPCTADSDSDGICDAEDKCPGFDDTIDTNGNGIPDGCESVCVQYTDNFSNSSLTHSGTGSNFTTLNLPTNSKDASFTINGLNDRLKGKSSNQYIEKVLVTYVDGLGTSKIYGSYNGANESSTSITITGTVKSITVNLSDGLTGNTSSIMSIDLSAVSYCVNNSSSKASTSSNKDAFSQQENHSLTKIDESIGGSFKIFPNPASNVLYVKNSKLINSNLDVSLYNINGSQIRSYNLNDKYTQTYELDINGLPPGLYLLRISGESGNFLKTERIIIK